MRTYDTPGAYIERDDRAQGGIARLRTDVVAFVGIAERGPARRAVPIESWKQFAAIFGSFFVHGYLAYVVRAFFENGGRRCWIVRVESDAAQCASVLLRSKAALGTPLLQVQANSSGTWGNALSLRLVETRRVAQRAIEATSDAAQVDSTAGFVRGSTVELIQESGGVVLREQRVLSGVDVLTGQLIWNHALDVMRLASDQPLAVVNPARPLRVESISYQLQVFAAGRPWRVYDDLALSPAHARYAPNVVNGVASLFAPSAELPGASAGETAALVALGRRARTGVVPEPVRIVELREAPEAACSSLSTSTAALLLTGGIDGLGSLRADDFIGVDDPLNDRSDAILSNRRGIAALAEIDEVSLVAVPDIHIQPRVVTVIAPPRCVPDPCLPGPPIAPVPAVVTHTDPPPRFSSSDIERVIAALINHCEARRDRVALIDPPFAAATQDRLGTQAVRDYRRLFDSTYAALYFPWLDMLDALPGVRSPTLPIPPCGHVAGLIAATDLRVGVHKAPANVPLLMAERTTFAIDETLHGVLNLEGINVIRAISGRGLRVVGARLISSNNDFRFLNVRRLLLMIERSIEASIQWAVFEGNDWFTRTKLALTIDSFLRELWSRGALMGATPEEAFFVKCDDANNPADARARGELLVQVGVAPSVPFEFVVLRIGRSANGFELSEAGVTGG